MSLINGLLVSSLNIGHCSILRFQIQLTTVFVKVKIRFIDALLFNDITVFAIHFLNN